MWGSCVCYARHITSSLPLNLGKKDKTCNLPKMFNTASVSVMTKTRISMNILAVFGQVFILRRREQCIQLAKLYMAARQVSSHVVSLQSSAHCMNICLNSFQILFSKVICTTALYRFSSIRTFFFFFCLNAQQQMLTALHLPLTGTVPVPTHDIT